jgi:hypothetical protein
MTAHTVDGLMNVVHEAIGAAYDCGAYHRSPSFGMLQTKRDAALERVRTYAAALAQSNAEAVLQELVACHFSVLEHPDPEEEARRSHARMGAAWKRALEVLGQIHRAGVLDVYGSAALAGQAPKVPEGFALVPLEPTFAMQHAYNNAAGSPSPWFIKDGYRAMLAAAPKTPAPKEQT